MQPNNTVMRVAKKEIILFFSSPIAYLFLAAFAGICLFSFFWGSAFFARGIADVRPLFEAMPILLIFLASSLTMRLWSEERKSGTLEFILTQPVPLWHFVLGKFLSCVFLLTIALAITLPLPITVSVLAQLDWGPVLAAYLATILLGSAYISMGLFVSAKTDSQIVCLLLAVALCGVFYLIGSEILTDFASDAGALWLRLLGTGSRFDSIARGVIDLRDLYYYVSLILIFLALNCFTLERERWAQQSHNARHHYWRGLTVLFIVNILAANAWLHQLHSVRIDTTAGRQYSISAATRVYLQQLQEPLILRGYFSEKTHPLLAPLVPQLRDLLNEYAIAGKGKVRVEFIDPTDSPQEEERANQQYAIQPVPLQVADRHQAAVVNAYFNLVVEYGSEHQVMGFRDLIEVKTQPGQDVDVMLRNPEHDITRAIKKVLMAYQTSGNLFDVIQGDLSFDAYISADNKLPASLQQYRKTVMDEVQKWREKSADRLKINIREPEADGGHLAKTIEAQYGFKPMTTNLFSGQTFYFYLTLKRGEQVVAIPIEDMNATNFARNFTAALKRFAPGFTKTLALVTPASSTEMDHYGVPRSEFNDLQDFLGEDVTVINDNLTNGVVPSQADIILLAAPENFSEKQLFAVDQFLMRGGTVIVASSPYKANLNERELSLATVQSGLQDWLQHHGFAMGNSVVLDAQNVPIAAPVTRRMGGYDVQEIRLTDYPFFVDVRENGLNPNHPISQFLPNITVPWASPVTVDKSRHAQRSVVELLTSSEQSWTSTTNVITPSADRGASQWQPEGTRGKHLLGVMSEGVFTSYFNGKSSPLMANTGASTEQLSNIIERSPTSARLILLSSNNLLQDRSLRLTANASHNNNDAFNALQFIANAVDYSLEDANLLTIRSRGHFNRTLPQLAENTQLFWEYLNYGLVLCALAMLGVSQMQLKRRRQTRQQAAWI